MYYRASFVSGVALYEKKTFVFTFQDVEQLSCQQRIFRSEKRSEGDERDYDPLD